ncbi:MAG: single-stranded DNA-binding protein, partial [bacterium]
MGSLNQVTLLGNLGKDPEVRKTPSGDSVATFTIATNEYWTKDDGTKGERTEWHRIVAWRRLAEIVGQYCKKGRSVLIVGRLRSRSWEDSEGVKRYITEIE